MQTHGRRVRPRGADVHKKLSRLRPKKKMSAHLPVSQDCGQQTKLTENHGSVRPKTYTGPGFPQLVCFFENSDGETRSEQGYSGRNAADPPAYNSYRLARHFAHSFFLKSGFSLQRCCKLNCLVAGDEAGKRGWKQLLVFERLEGRTIS
jgi:hypothetical protein